ncbi:MAG: hypothetical protein PUC46_03320 [Lachnospiraceae bacterium]|nr:hypothetical protein [Lachnospiraceae bacterium]
MRRTWQPKAVFKGISDLGMIEAIVMTIEHNALPYIIPGFFALICLVGGIDSWGDNAATAMVIIGVLTALLCYGHRETYTLSFRDGRVTATGPFENMTSPREQDPILRVLRMVMLQQSDH